MMKKLRYFLPLILCFFFSGLASAEDLTISSDTIWDPGTYTYDNVLITNGATLTFNGAVTLNAQNLTIDSGSSISADAKGYALSQGPGSAKYPPGGGGYGGGGGGYSGVVPDGGSTYGSALTPTELGSGGGWGAGGGAIKLVISNALTVNGKITTSGQEGKSGAWGSVMGAGSGGSIYLIVNNLQGQGQIIASGGSGPGGGGGGGRIAIYYQSSVFTGRAEAKGGIGGWAGQSGEDGTVVFIDTINNVLCPGHSFRFQENDSPFNFNQVILDNSQITTQGSISLFTKQLLLRNSFFSLGGASIVKATNFSLQNNSSLTFNDTSQLAITNPSTLSNSSLSLTGSQTLGIPSLTLDNSVLALSGKETLTTSELTLTNNSILTHLPQGKVDLNLQNLTIDATSFLSADGKGYPAGQGPGAGSGAYAGAGYGGKGGSFGTNNRGGSAYGSAVAPLDLGSGGVAAPGGGAIRIIVSGNLMLNGGLTANGAPHWGYGGASGGSIYIITQSLSGSGTILANGAKGGTAYYSSGGGGGGRIAVYYQSSSFIGKAEAKGGMVGGDDGTVVLQGLSLDAPITSFTLFEKSSATSTLTETLSAQPLSLNNAVVSGDLSGSLSFNNLEIIKVVSGAFAEKGLIKGDFNATLDGLAYHASLEGIVYLVQKENKIYLKGEVEGELNGILEAILTESTPGSGVFDQCQATLKINRLKTESVSVALNLTGTLVYQPASTLHSELYLYQGNFEGESFGAYTGPLSAVVTHLRITGENEYKGQGFSFISYNTSLSQGEGYAFNYLTSPTRFEFTGLSQSPLLGKLTAILDEAASPKVLSGTIERLDLGIVPEPELKVKVWGPRNVSPGETVTYIVEYRNDGLKAADNVFVSCLLNTFEKYVYASPGVIYNPYAHRLSWKIPALAAKSSGLLSFQTDIMWGLPGHMILNTYAFITDTGE